MRNEIKPIERKSHAYYMRAALGYARRAAAEGEVPVGAVIVYRGRIIAGGRNRREKGKNALCHAEIEAINKACKRLCGWRLWECDMYVTLEPCPMCAGAIINSRIKSLYIGAPDEKAGCFGGLCDFNDMGFNHKPMVSKGILAEKCSAQLREFFLTLREKRSKEKE